MKAAAPALLLAVLVQAGTAASSPAEPKALAEARAAVKRDPRDARSRARLGKILREGGRCAEAAAELVAAQALDKTDSFTDLDLGLAYEALKRPEDADLHLHRFIARSGLPPDHSAMRLAREAQARLRGRPPGGGVSAVADGPRLDAQAARTMCRLGDLDECGRLAGRALAAAPRYAEAHYVAGLLAALRGNVPQALAGLSEAVALSPNHPDYRFSLARALRVAKRLKESEKEFKTVIAQAPDWAEAHLNLAVTYEAMNEMDKSLAAVRRAVDLDPYEGRALALLGHHVRMRGLNEDAVPILDRAQHALPLMPQPEFDLGMARMALGQKYEAEYHLRNFLRMTEKTRAPDDGWRLQAKAALESLR